MISKTDAARFIGRFADFPQFPKTKKGEDELLDALAHVAKDEEHAEEITSTLIRDLERAPLPRHIYEAARMFAETAEEIGPKPGDKPFRGFFELFDEEFIERLKWRAENARTQIERDGAKRLLEAWKADRKRVNAESAEGANA